MPFLKRMLTVPEFITAYSGIGKKKAESPFLRLFLLGILAGMFIGFGAAVSNTAAHTITGDAARVRFISGLTFPVGLIMVILTGSELFTGNSLISIAVFEKSTSLSRMLRSWLYVYLGNFAGSLLLALLLAFCRQFQYSNGMLAVYTANVALGKVSGSFLQYVGSGILCNLLVCCAVMMAICSKSVSGKILCAYVPVFTFVTCGFEHSIANMYYIPAGILASSLPRYADAFLAAGTDFSGLTWSAFLFQNLIPVTIGNIIGGVAFSAVIWYCNRPSKR